MIRVAGVVLCGGQSRRMGRPKAWLPLDAETLLQRIVRLVGQVAHPVVVVAAAGQPLPDLPADVWIVRDERNNAGPLEGLRAGLAALAAANAAHDRVRDSVRDGVRNSAHDGARENACNDALDNARDAALAKVRATDVIVEAVFATACDTPLLRPELIRFLACELEGQRAVVPVDGDHFHPLTAVYRLDVLPLVEALIERGESRLSALCEQPGIHRMPVDLLRAVDPQLESLVNINRPEEYESLLRR
jgi:molybdopterin-guanine dinucleotide biosynthesis protein A